VKVVISSGHSKYVRGAEGYLDEVDEARRVVEQVAKKLRGLGETVTTYHDDVSKSQDENLKRIVDFHNAQTRDLDVSVHFNANVTTTKPIGTECWYLTQAALADDIASRTARVSGLIDRGPKKSTSLYFLNNTERPAVLDEVCFVDSSADAELYRENFDIICRAIADAIAGEEAEPRPEPAPPAEAAFHAQGKCSWFGGPEDSGVDADEGLAFLYEIEDAPHLFLPEQPAGTTGLARRLDPGVMYVACRWDYARTPKSMLADATRKALVRAGGKEFRAYPADWGPHEDTGRIADVSPALLKALDLQTDDDVEVIYPAPPQ
jgi:N-acetylmuramoyl-L-alanine amidase